MSISSIATKVTYSGNNSDSTPYPLTGINYVDSTHIKVFADGVDISSDGLNYCTFTGDGTTGAGEFITSLPYAPTVAIEVFLTPDLDQPVSLQETGSLPAKTLENQGFDRLNMQIRWLARRVASCFTLGNTEDASSTGTADNLLGFDGSGDIAEIPNTTFAQTANDLSDLNDAATARTNLGVDAAGTDNSTDVTKTGAGTYISLAGQVLTADEITETDLNASINASLDKADTAVQVANNLSDVTAATARTNLGVDAAGTDNSTDVTKAGTGTYVSLDTGTQVLTVDEITETDLNASINASLDLADTSIQSLASIEGNSLLSTGATVGQVLQSDGDTTCSFVDLIGGGNAQTANPLSQFAATTSAELAGVISDETGTGALVFATSPTLVTPALGTPSAVDLTNATNTPLPTAGTVTEAMLNASTNASLDLADTALQSIAADSITYDMVQDVTAADKILGSVAGGTVSEITCTSAGRALLDDADAAAQRATLGLNLVFDVRNYGTTGNGTTDDTTFIQDAIDAAELVTDAVEDTGVAVGRSAAVVDLAGGRYRITDTLVISKPIIFQNGSLIATTAMTGTTAAGLAATYMLYVDAPYAVVQNIKLDGGTDGAYNTATACLNDLVRSKGARTEFNNVDGWHFNSFGFNITGGYHQSFNNCDMIKWTADDTVGVGTDTHHTGVAFYSTNHTEYYGCYVANCSTGWQLNGFGNRLSNCRFAGGTPTFTTAIPAKAVHIAANQNHLVGCTFEGGDVYLDEDPDNMISTCRFTPRNNSAGIVTFFDSATNVTCAGLIVTGCQWANAATGIEFTTNTGSYASDYDKKIQWIGNSKINGGTIWKRFKAAESVQYSQNAWTIGAFTYGNLGQTDGTDVVDGTMAVITNCNTTTRRAVAAGGGSNTVMVMWDSSEGASGEWLVV